MRFVLALLFALIIAPARAQYVQQTGTITPGHLTCWTTTGVINDCGLTFSNTYGMFVSIITGVNFNAANTDNPIVINLPSGYTRYRIHNILISGASGTLTTSTVGVFTATGAGGTAVVTSGTSVTVSASSTDTNNNMQSLTVNDQNTLALSDGALFFRTQTAQGVAVTANVAVFYQPMP